MRIRSIGVLAGGFSEERDISLKSGAAVSCALSQLGYNVCEIDFRSQDEFISKLKSVQVDCIFNALHGSFGEDGQAQAIMDDLEIIYTGSGPHSSSLGMDKIASRKIFTENGFFVPEYQIVKSLDFKLQGFFLKTPLVVKPVHCGSSIGISIVNSSDELLCAVQKALALDNLAVVEEYVAGREITVGILDDQALPIIEILSKNSIYDFQAKYDSSLTEYKLPAFFSPGMSRKIQKLALKAHHALGCRCFSRVDMIINQQDCPVVLEVNTIPGFTNTSLLPKAALFAGISFPALCQRILDAVVNCVVNPAADQINCSANRAKRSRIFN
ncbi:MAG: D-alanine--D-alanine ligase [Candidatus Omnitrophota bacterium]|nr:MAG: D-alanine--D-alanine ligase [Candidatus Omnitrophota bacterium]